MREPFLRMQAGGRQQLLQRPMRGDAGDRDGRSLQL
jgi:hypothetical protein